jgi:hypothetical protein
MGLPGEEILGSLLSTLIIRHKLDQWAKLVIALAVSGVATWLAVFGAVGATLLSAPATYQRIGWDLAFALVTACAAAAGAIYRKYARSPLSRGEPAEVPADIKGPPAGFQAAPKT